MTGCARLEKRDDRNITSKNICSRHYTYWYIIYSGPSLLRSPTGLGKSDVNCITGDSFHSSGLSKGDCSEEDTLLLR